MKLPVTMRQNHAPGDKLFVDYAGDKVAVVVDRLTGEIRDAHIFVAVLGASSLTYAEGSWTETLPDWLAAHTRALAMFGGAPALFVPDNAKVAVIKACLYDPQVNRSYAEMAAHYDSTVLPTRPRRPRDKAKVEAAVLIVERWLFGRLRRRTFFGLAELNAAIAELLAELNDRRVLRRVGRTRRQLFEEIDRPALKPLPAERYVYAEWRRRRAGLDYHVEIERHYYLVPYRFAREPIEARITAATIELFHKGERIAAHMRGSGNGRHTTIPEHMPSSHRRFADWTGGYNWYGNSQIRFHHRAHRRESVEEILRSCLRRHLQRTAKPLDVAPGREVLAFGRQQQAANARIFAHLPKRGDQ